MKYYHVRYKVPVSTGFIEGDLKLSMSAGWFSLNGARRYIDEHCVGEKGRTGHIPDRFLAGTD